MKYLWKKGGDTNRDGSTGNNGTRRAILQVGSTQQHSLRKLVGIYPLGKS